MFFRHATQSRVCDAALPHHSAPAGTSAVVAAGDQTLIHNIPLQVNGPRHLSNPIPDTHTQPTLTMAKKGGAGGGDTGGSKKAQGQARKADAAASKQAAKDQQAAAAEAEKWDKGAKSNAKA